MKDIKTMTDEELNSIDLKTIEESETRIKIQNERRKREFLKMTPEEQRTIQFKKWTQ